MQELNIVELIEHNPIVKLSNTYNNKLLIKIKENFTGFEEHYNGEDFEDAWRDYQVTVFAMQKAQKKKAVKDVFSTAKAMKKVAQEMLESKKASIDEIVKKFEEHLKLGDEDKELNLVRDILKLE